MTKENIFKLPIYKIPSIEEIEARADAKDVIFNQGKDPLEIIRHYHPDCGFRVSIPKWKLWNLDRGQVALAAYLGVERVENILDTITKDNIERYRITDPDELEN